MHLLLSLSRCRATVISHIVGVCCCEAFGLTTKALQLHHKSHSNHVRHHHYGRPFRLDCVQIVTKSVWMKKKFNNSCNYWFSVLLQWVTAGGLKPSQGKTMGSLTWMVGNTILMLWCPKALGHPMWLPKGALKQPFVAMNLEILSKENQKKKLNQIRNVMVEVVFHFSCLVSHE